jgi:hypothetical protein
MGLKDKKTLFEMPAIREHFQKYSRQDFDPAKRTQQFKANKLI